MAEIRIIESQILARNFGTLKKTTLEFRRRDGTWQRISRETYDSGNGVGILLYDPQRGTVLLVRQFRYPAYAAGHPEPLLEVCAGLLDGGDPAETVVREAEEECGVRVSNPRRLLDVFMTPGSVTEKLTLFAAPYSAGTRIGDGGGLRHEGEDIEVVELPFAEALAMAGDGRIVDGKTILLLQYAALANLFG